MKIVSIYIPLFVLAIVGMMHVPLHAVGRSTELNNKLKNLDLDSTDFDAMPTRKWSDIAQEIKAYALQEISMDKPLKAAVKIVDDASNTAIIVIEEWNKIIKANKGDSSTAQQSIALLDASLDNLLNLRNKKILTKKYLIIGNKNAAMLLNNFSEKLINVIQYVKTVLNQYAIIKKPLFAKNMIPYTTIPETDTSVEALLAKNMSGELYVAPTKEEIVRIIETKKALGPSYTEFLRDIKGLIYAPFGLLGEQYDLEKEVIRRLSEFQRTIQSSKKPFSKEDITKGIKYAISSVHTMYVNGKVHKTLHKKKS